MKNYEIGSLTKPVINPISGEGSPMDDFDKDDPDKGEMDAVCQQILKIKEVAAKHFGSPEALDHWRMADFIWKRRFGSLQEFWKTSEVIDDLSQLRKSLKNIRRIMGHLPEPITERFRQEALQSVL